MLVTTSASASIVMTGTRVIFPSAVTEKIIQFKNPDPQPYVVQLQFTKEDNEPDDLAPFVLVPPVFRMEPHTGQSVRLIANNTSGLPQDKESVFYLNFTQLPALKATQKDQNQLVIAVTSRVKIFYRPELLKGQQSDAYQSLKFSLKDGSLFVDNPTGFYITVRKAELVINGNTSEITKSLMISPKSTMKLHTIKKLTSLEGALLKLTLVNDYGTDVKREMHL